MAPPAFEKDVHRRPVFLPLELLSGANKLKLYLDSLLAIAVVIYRKERFSQSATPRPHVSFKGGTVSQYLQNVTRVHLNSFYGYLQNWLRAFQAKRIQELCCHYGYPTKSCSLVPTGMSSKTKT